MYNKYFACLLTCIRDMLIHAHNLKGHKLQHGKKSHKIRTLPYRGFGKR